MALPPDDVTPSALFLKLCEAPAPSEEVDFPRRDQQTGKAIARCRIFVLPHEAHTKARATAEKRLAAVRDPKVPHTVASDEILSDYSACEVLAMSVHDSKPFAGEGTSKPSYRRLFQNAHDVERLLSSDEVAALFTMYAIVQRKYGPVEDSFENDAEVNAWVERLVVGASELPLGHLLSHQLVALCSRLAARAAALSSVLSSPPESLPTCLASIPSSWGFGTFLSGEPSTARGEGDDVPQPGDLITPARAAEIADDLWNRK